MKVVLNVVLLKKAYRLKPTQSRVLKDTRRLGLLLRSITSNFFEQSKESKGLGHEKVSQEKRASRGCISRAQRYGHFEGPHLESIRRIEATRVERISTSRKQKRHDEYAKNRIKAGDEWVSCPRDHHRAEVIL